MSVSSSLRWALAAPLPSDKLGPAVCDYCMADKARERGRPIAAQWAQADAAMGAEHLPTHPPATLQRGDVTSTLEGGWYSGAGTAVHLLRSAPAAMPVAAALTPYLVAGMVAPLLGTRVAMAEMRRAAMPPWLLFSLWTGCIDWALSLDVPKPDAGPPARGGVGQAQDHLVFWASRAIPDSATQRCLLAAAVGLRWATEVPRLAILWLVAAAAFVGGVFGLSAVAAEFAAAGVSRLSQAAAMRLHLRSPTAGDDLNAADGAEAGLGALPPRNVAHAGELAGGREDPGLAEGRLPNAWTAPVGGPVALPRAQNAAEFAVGLNVHSQGRTPAVLSSADRLMRRYVVARGDIRPTLAQIRLFIVRLVEAGSSVATTLHPSAARGGRNRDATVASAALRVLRFAQQTAAIPGDLRANDAWFSHLLATAWVAIGHLEAHHREPMRDPDAAARAVQSERRVALVRALARSVEDAGYIVCPEGRADFVLMVLNNVCPEVRIEGTPTVGEVLQQVGPAIRRYLGDRPTPEEAAAVFTVAYCAAARHVDDAADMARELEMVASEEYDVALHLPADGLVGAAPLLTAMRLRLRSELQAPVTRGVFRELVHAAYRDGKAIVVPAEFAAFRRGMRRRLIAGDQQDQFVETPRAALPT